MRNRRELGVAIVVVVISLVAAFVWIPLDTETGMVETYRRQTFIGDAFLPKVSAIAMLVAGLIQLVLVLRLKPDGAETESGLDGVVIGFFLVLFGIIFVALVLMNYAGPVSVALFGPEATDGSQATYRQLRSTAPWKYIGFLLGGFVLLFGTTTLIEGRFRRLRVLTSVLGVVLLILVFDVPFDNILLPPNGDW